MRAPVVFPQPTTLSSSAAEGRLITHSLEALSALKLWLRLLTTQPISGGSNSIMVCQDMTMMFAFFPCVVVSKTTGPGSSRR